MLLLSGLMLAMTALQAQNWTLVWSDEFEGDTLNTDKWSYMIGDGTEYGLPSGWGNNELQYYREGNVEVSDGNLILTAKRENIDTKQFTSGRIRTKGKGDWTYGRFTFSALMPTGKGLWPALWMLPTDEAYGGWAASGEIDIMEYLGDETNKVHGTLHFGAAWPNNDYKGTSYVTDGISFDSAFHHFALEWEPGEMRWYVDSVLFQTLGQGDWYTGTIDFPAPFDKPFHLLINLAVGGNWPGNPDINTQFPQELVVDYVRIYQDASLGISHGTSQFELEQNHPNPFSGQTTITFSLPTEEQVVLELYDSTGRRVRTLADQRFAPGTHAVELGSGGLTPGLYTYRLLSSQGSSTRQMLIL
jgi:beta-glucanase (GH16 family)